MQNNLSLANILRTLNVITMQQYLAITNDQPVMEIINLLQLNAVQVAKHLAAYFALEFLDLCTISIEDIAIELLAKYNYRYHFLPLKKFNNTLTLIIADPSHIDTIQQLFFTHNNALNFMLADCINFNRLINQCQRQLIYPKNHLVALPSHISTVCLLQQIFEDASVKQASDIHFEAHTSCYQIRLRIDGMLINLLQLANHVATAVINRIKILANLDTTQRRLPQDGRFTITTQLSGKRECRLNVCPTLYGEKAVIRLLNTKQRVLEINELGMTAKQQKTFTTYINKPQGLIIVTGPTGSGKTITLYSALQHISKTNLNICSIEDPIEISLPMMNQINTNHQIGLDFAQALRALLRQDPDVIMIGEIRDKETASMAIHAAQTGHLVFTTLHTNSSVEALVRLLNMGIENYLLVDSLNLIISQRLIRRLCNCQSQPNDCNFCQQGFRGRVGIFELLAIDKHCREIIAHYPAQLIAQHLKPLISMNLWQAGQLCIQQKLTTYEELCRVVSPPEN